MSYSKLPKSKNKNDLQLQNKKERPKPEWTTDFIDRDQYKLSTTEMIQKKASLQSKNRELARQQLQQRRRKLQMGILDEQTKKIYETALTSKNIDINPPMRRNLTEMIRYEKEHREKANDHDQNNQEEGENQQCDDQEQSYRDIKEAQEFIRKFQKAKKQQKIQRAVEILTNNKTEKFQSRNNGTVSPSGESRKNKFLDDSKQEKPYAIKSKHEKSPSSFSQDEALSNIEDTIRFMEEKLFAAKKTVQENSKSFINQSENQESFAKQNNYNDFNKIKANNFLKSNPEEGKKTRNQSEFFKKKSQKSNQIDFTTTNNFYNNGFDNQFEEKIGQISQLKINLKHENSSDDECLDTIRRMRELMEDKQFQCESSNRNNKSDKLTKQNFSQNSLGYNSTIHKNQMNSESEVEVSFNLTLNNDDDYQQQSSLLKDRKKDETNKMIKVENSYKPSEGKGKKIADQNKADYKKSKQDEYEEQYQKIKQNLFQCIHSDPNPLKGSSQPQKHSKKSNQSKFQKYDLDSQEESEDSLMIKDRINMWKKQLEPQQEPQDQQEDEQINFKTTTFTKKSEPSTKMFVKANDDQEQEETYKFNFLNQNPNKKIPIKDKIEQMSYDNYPGQKIEQNAPKNQRTIQFMKKPPISKKIIESDNHLSAMKQMISKASSQIKKIQIQPLRIEPLNPTGQILGFDFRGSINIKKNVISK